MLLLSQAPHQLTRVQSLLPRFRQAGDFSLLEGHRSDADLVANALVEFIVFRARIVGFVLGGKMAILQKTEIIKNINIKQPFLL